ncbi:hypothetical protein [Haloechinothrix sp. LS1_15]|uniref:hypothetical protein n=1 Tax=Haloechinothrix sp. LS1_15 TaxID=2652248 RepID=UPI002947184C|nr:hypothetical protein [Haloechinothrix sp. LS1_15]MDV6012433.1 hypothetical protein [Haloechinothrix sp. LS1_15]
MTDHELRLLRHAACGELLFHRGSWGGPSGYRWRGPDGIEAGRVPPWDETALDRLAEHRLIAIESRRGPLDRRVHITGAGVAALVATARAA